MFKHLIPSGKDIWASAFMMLLAGGIYEDRSDDIAM
jgi:hypothetical protein